jgi:monofunctional glycosyltransferase
VFPRDHRSLTIDGAYQRQPASCLPRRSSVSCTESMAEFREPGPDDPPTGVERGVWTTGRKPNTAAPARTVTPAPPTQPAPASAVPTAKPIVTQTPPTPRRRLTPRLIARTLGLLVLLIIGATLAQLLAYRWIAPPTSMLMLTQRLSGTTITRAWRPLDRISPHLARAVIMSEDAGFCGHRGVDWKELERVYEQSLEGGATGGGSTLSMQVTKNLFLWSSKSYVRKAIEVPLTLLADRWWGKPRMLEIYLNVAECGSRSTRRRFAQSIAAQRRQSITIAAPPRRNRTRPHAQRRKQRALPPARHLVKMRH